MLLQLFGTGIFMFYLFVFLNELCKIKFQNQFRLGDKHKTWNFQSVSTDLLCEVLNIYVNSNYDKFVNAQKNKFR